MKISEAFYTFEQIWDRRKTGYNMIPKRVERFDPTSSLFYSPIEYEFNKIGYVTDNPPDSIWLANSFREFVRGEFKSSTKNKEEPPPIIKIERKEITIKVVHDYLAQCENELVYSGLIDSITGDVDGMSEKIYAIFSDSILGNRDNKKYLNSSLFINSIKPLIDQQLRLRFVMPCFPFKDQCDLRTAAPPSHVDFGEIALLIRLHLLALALYQVHPFGADWVLFSDGRFYANILRVDVSEVNKYFTRLLELRNLLNIDGTVSIIDLKDITRQIESKEQGNNVFEYMADEICNRLKMLVSNDKELRDTFQVLARGMKKNVSLKDLLEELSWNEKWLMFNSESADDLSPSLRDLWRKIEEIVNEASYKYAAYNLALRYYSIVQKVFPDTIRATIHAKPNQLAVPKLGDVYPWNGVGVHIKRKEKPIIETWAFHSILQKANASCAYYLPNDVAPFFYEIYN